MNFMYFYMWPILNNLYNKTIETFISDERILENKNKITRNFISATNAGGIIVCSGLFFYTKNITFYNLSLIIPYTYYIWDTMYILILNKKNEYGYLYHHFVALLLLYQLETKTSFGSWLYTGLVIAEISNITTYIVYHLKKILDNTNKNHQRKLLFWQKSQLIWYGIFRIPIGGRLIYKGYGVGVPIIPLLQYTSLYILGIFWFTKQLGGYRSTKKLYEDNKTEM